MAEGSPFRDAVFDAILPDWFAHRAVKSFESLALKVKELIFSDGTSITTAPTAVDVQTFTASGTWTKALTDNIGGPMAVLLERT